MKQAGVLELSPSWKDGLCKHSDDRVTQQRKTLFFSYPHADGKSRVS